MKLELGSEVVCPDGKVRHFPYHNQGDALCDARTYSRKGCRAWGGEPSPLEEQLPPCPEGGHTVRLVAFVEPRVTERSVA